MTLSTRDLITAFHVGESRFRVAVAPRLKNLKAQPISSRLRFAPQVAEFSSEFLKCNRGAFRMSLRMISALVKSSPALSGRLQIFSPLHRVAGLDP